MLTTGPGFATDFVTALVSFATDDVALADEIDVGGRP